MKEISKQELPVTVPEKNVFIKLAAGGRVHQYTKLIDKQVCRDAIEKLEKSLYVASDDQAVELGKLLVGLYPKREANDPAIFSKGIASVFQEFPPDIGKEAVDVLTKQSKWLPTRAEVYESLTYLAKDRKKALEQARMHIDEHERRGIGGSKLDQETREQKREGMQSTYAGMYINAGMEAPKTGELTIGRFNDDLAKHKAAKEAKAKDWVGKELGVPPLDDDHPEVSP